MADIFISYTNSDRDWAFWIGHELESLGHKARIHEWEIPGGGDIIVWMEERLDAADYVLCVVSQEYLMATYSSWERRSAQWAASSEKRNFLLPVYVRPCKSPKNFATLKRCDLHGLTEEDARACLEDFLKPAHKKDGPFPAAAKAASSVTARSLPLRFPGEMWIQKILAATSDDELERIKWQLSILLKKDPVNPELLKAKYFLESTMSPQDDEKIRKILVEFQKENPQAASSILGLLAAFIVGTFVATLGIDLEARVAPVLYVLGIGLVLNLIPHLPKKIVEDRLITAALQWFLLMLAVLWVGVVFAERVNPKSEQLACAVRFWESCRATADSMAQAESAPPARAEPVILPNAGFQRSSYKVFVQFAGAITRDSVRTMMGSLHDIGWNVQGVNAGGERIAATAGYTEIRYATSVDMPAALALASEVQAAKVISHAISVKFTPSVAKGSLEVWISR